MSALLKLIYRVDTVPIKMPGGVFVEIDRLILKLTWGSKISKITGLTLEKKSDVGRFTLCDFKAL